MLIYAMIFRLNVSESLQSLKEGMAFRFTYINLRRSKQFEVVRVNDTTSSLVLIFAFDRFHRSVNFQSQLLLVTCPPAYACFLT